MIVLAWNHAENHLKYRGDPKCFEVCETRMCSINLPHIQVRETKNTRFRWFHTWARDTVRWYSSAETLLRQLSTDHNIDVQSVFSWAPKLARKCKRKHWYICGGGRRSVGRAYGHVITKFSRMGRLPHFHSYGAPPTRARGAPLKKSNKTRVLLQ